MSTATTVTVSVTQEHINEGIPESCSQCPIALALLAAIPDAEVADVWTEGGEARATIWIDGTRRTRNFRLPHEAADFIWGFDRGVELLPFTFIAEVLS